MTGPPDTDLRHMRHALTLAGRNLGVTWPNPSVGCVIVKNGRIVGRAVTARGGRPHAETLALAQAGEDARGATLYVTLEPCRHHGQTPPCAESILAAGIARVVAACEDPHPEMRGRSLRRLAEAGLEISSGVAEQEAEEVNAGFFSVQRRGAPLVSLKLATALDGRMTTGDPGNPWITGEPARAFGHLLRSRHDAILTGIGTALADDPLLTCRLPGLESRSPVRVLLDRRLRLPPESKLLNSLGAAPLWIAAAPEALESEKADALRKSGVTLLSCTMSGQEFALPELLQLLAKRGITRLLAEAGPRLSGSFLEQRLVDRLYWFRAPVVIGGGEKAAARGIMDKTTVANESQMPHFVRVEARPLGRDLLEIYRKYIIGRREP